MTDKELVQVVEISKKGELPQLEDLICDGVLPHVSHDWSICPVSGLVSATCVTANICRFLVGFNHYSTPNFYVFLRRVATQ